MVRTHRGQIPAHLLRSGHEWIAASSSGTTVRLIAVGRGHRRLRRRGAAAQRGYGERGQHEQRERLRQPDPIGEQTDQRRANDEARIADREGGGQ